MISAAWLFLRPLLAAYWKYLLAIAVAAVLVFSLYHAGSKAGAARVQAKWDAERAAMAKDLHRREENAERARQEAGRQAVAAERRRVERFAGLAERAAAAARRNPLVLTPDDVGLFDAARSAAEASRPSGEPREAPPPAADSTQEYIRQLNEWAAIALERVELLKNFYREQQEIWK